MVQIKSFAKVNLNLKVSKKKNFQNLHKIKTTMTIVNDLFDLIEIKIFEEPILKLAVKTKHQIDKNFFHNNSIKKIFYYLVNKKIITNGMGVTIIKNIPLGSGLAGGTSNAVSFLNWCSHYFRFVITKKIKNDVAKLIGSDAYFFLESITSAKISQYGNKIKKINPINFTKANIVFNNLICNTGEVYKTFDDSFSPTWKKLPNMLQSACFLAYPELNDLFNSLENKESYIISGSGSSFIKITTEMRF